MGAQLKACLPLLTLLLVLLLAGGCAGRKNISPLPTIDPQVRTEMQKPINCSTAHRDVRILEEEKASVGKRMLSGVRSVLPISAVAGILMGDYSDRVAVATGTYNDDIDKKIKQIKNTCGGFPK